MKIIQHIVILSVILFCILFILAFLPPETRIFNRYVWYNPPEIIDWQLDAKSTSQQIVDIYSITHISHGVIFFLLLKWLGTSVTNAIYMSILLEILYEIISNTPEAIKIYRDKWPNYEGDSLINIVGDIIFTLVGVYLAYKLPTLGIMYVIITELILYKYSAGLVSHLHTFYTRTLEQLL